MTTHEQTHTGRTVPLVSALFFLVAYVLVTPVSGALADRALPVPDDPVGDLVAYLAANPVAVLATATLQIVSVLGLLVFARALRLGGRLDVLAGCAFVAMIVSAIVSVSSVPLVDDVAESTVGLLRQLSFYTGGVVHVVTLGAFVLAGTRALHRAAVIGRAMRTFGWIAGGIAVLSILSIAFYYANAFLPLGRVTCMVWSVSVGIVWWRRHT